jgi:hypothetical protein
MAAPRLWQIHQGCKCEGARGTVFHMQTFARVDDVPITQKQHDLLHYRFFPLLMFPLRVLSACFGAFLPSVYTSIFGALIIILSPNP